MTALSVRTREIATWTARHVTGDRSVLLTYAAVAARWEAMRDRATLDPSPAVLSDLHRLTVAVAALSARVGLCTTRVDGEHTVPGVTNELGFLPGDPERLMPRD